MPDLSARTMPVILAGMHGRFDWRSRHTMEHETMTLTQALTMIVAARGMSGWLTLCAVAIALQAFGITL